MVFEVTPNYDSQWAAINAVAQRLGVGTAETVRKWVRQAETDTGLRAGMSSDESAQPGPVVSGRRILEPAEAAMLEGGVAAAVGRAGDGSGSSAGGLADPGGRHLEEAPSVDHGVTGNHGLMCISRAWGVRRSRGSVRPPRPGAGR